MRILIASLASKECEDGVAKVAQNAANGLRGLGHIVTCLFKEDILGRQEAKPRLEAAYFGFKLASELRRRRAEFDVVNIHAPAGFAYGLFRRLYPAGRLPPYVVLVHGIEERRNYAMAREVKKGRASHLSWGDRIWQNLYRAPLHRWSITTADYAVTVNQEAWTMLEVKYRREIRRVWYIPNGVETRFLLHREYPEISTPRLLYVGTWVDEKGIYYLRDGFEDLVRRFPSVQLTIAGCRVQADSVKQWFSPPVQNHVEVLPFVPATEMPALYARHDIFVFPSLVEGMPVVLLEAMATGMAVVTTETCGMADIVEDEYNGLLVKPADTAAFVSAVGRIVESSELRARLGHAAQEKMKRHTWDRIAMRLEKVLASAVAEQKGK
jgi:glycosyltransferase involved in cell wall biosynthesis